MQNVILRFKSAKDLWEFKTRIKSAVVDINMKDFILECTCNEAEILLAIQIYNAQVEECKTVTNASNK
jgi:hypothetical protein